MKGEEVKYISHLDLARALPRAFRRAKITLAYSQGFHPMPVIQYGPALGVGMVGENELIDFDSADELIEAPFLEQINAVMPQGLFFKGLKPLPPGAGALVKEINRAEYLVPLDGAELGEAIGRLCGQRPALACR